MATYPPPIETPSLWNSSDWPTSSSSLTYTLGDARYLKLAGGTVSGNLQVGSLPNIYINTSTNQIGVNTPSPGYAIDCNGIVNTRNSYYVNSTQVLTGTGLGSSLTSSSASSFTFAGSVGVTSGLTVTGGVSTDTLTASGALSGQTLGLSYSSAATTLPTLSTQNIGYSISTTTIYTSSFSSTSASVARLSIPATGIWLLMGSMTFSGSGTGIQLYWNVAGSTYAVQGVGNPTSSFAFVMANPYVWSNTSSVLPYTVQLIAVNNGSNNTVNSVYAVAIRLA